MVEYWLTHSDKFMTALLEHLEIVVVTLVISIVLASVLTLLIFRSSRLSEMVISLFSGIYSIPSLALFALLIPVTGLGMVSTLIVLVLYNQYLLIRNFVTGLYSVDHSLLEVATGMGMTRWQVLYKVQIPLALPLIFAGIRLAIISTIGIATIAATVGAGGLGKILFEGLRQMNMAKIFGGTLLCALIAISADIILKYIEGRILARYHQ